MLLDIGAGIFVSLFLSKVFLLPLTPAFLGLGIFFALWPDIDILASWKTKGGAHAHEHREMLHYPLLVIPAGMSVLVFFNLPLALLFGFATLLHFLHDSIGIGWGIEWLYPFSKDHYAFFYQYQGPKEKLPRKSFYKWRHEELPGLVERYGDEEWLRNIYLKLHPYAIVELGVFLAALLALWLSR